MISDRSHGRALVKNQLLSLLIVYLFLLILLLMDRLSRYLFIISILDRSGNNISLNDTLSSGCCSYFCISPFLFNFRKKIEKNFLKPSFSRLRFAFLLSYRRLFFSLTVMSQVFDPIMMWTSQFKMTSHLAFYYFELFYA